MLDHNFDPRSLRVRALEVLQEFPDGVSCADLASYMDTAQYTLSSVLSKLHCYGTHDSEGRRVHKIQGAFGNPCGKGILWKLAK